MKILALTGSIATGKTTVSRILSSPPYSLPLIDADLFAHSAVLPGTRAHALIVSTFWASTPGLLGPEPETNNEGRPLPQGWRGRSLDRKVLGARVFGDEEDRRAARRRLEGIVHPAVRREMAWAVTKAYARGEAVVLVDVPLLFEAGLDVLAGFVVVVGVREREVQIRRLVDRDGRGEQEARKRVGSQMSVAEKVGRLEGREGGVVWNDGSREDLGAEVKRVLVKLGWDQERERWGWKVRIWGWVCLLVPPIAGVTALWSVWSGWTARRRWEGRKQKDR